MIQWKVNDPNKYFMINLHESMGLDQQLTTPGSAIGLDTDFAMWPGNPVLFFVYGVIRFSEWTNEMVFSDSLFIDEHYQAVEIQN